MQDFCRVFPVAMDLQIGAGAGVFIDGTETESHSLHGNRCFLVRFLKTFQSPRTESVGSGPFTTATTSTTSTTTAAGDAAGVEKRHRESKRCKGFLDGCCRCGNWFWHADVCRCC